MKPPLDREAIEAILPHRPPFLFVDAILELAPGARIVGEWRVRETERFLSAERDGRSVLPSTILVEAMAQVGAILALYPKENRGRTIFFRAIEDTEFHRHVAAGSLVRVEAKVKKMRASFGVLTVRAHVDGEAIAGGTMSFALG